MRFQFILITCLTSIAAVHALQAPTWPQLSSLVRRQGGSTCPSFWQTIGKDLQQSFLTTDKRECNDMARAAVRYAFHDAGTFSLKLPFAWPAAGGADGSLLLASSEIGRPANGGLGPYHGFIGGKLGSYRSQFGNGVGAADLIQFAASVATVVCPGGPIVKTVVGRVDSTQASPANLLPPGFGQGSDHDSLLNLFSDKGFYAKDLAALIGAHSVATAFAQSGNGVPVNASLDSTPGKWDNNFYGETYNPPPGISRLQSDINLSDPAKAVGQEFRGFVGNSAKWALAFADAMHRLSVLGIPQGISQGFADCTSALPGGTASTKRMRSAPLMERWVK